MLLLLLLQTLCPAPSHLKLMSCNKATLSNNLAIKVSFRIKISIKITLSLIKLSIKILMVVMVAALEVEEAVVAEVVATLSPTSAKSLVMMLQTVGTSLHLLMLQTVSIFYCFFYTSAIPLILSDCAGTYASANATFCYLCAAIHASANATYAAATSNFLGYSSSKCNVSASAFFNFYASTYAHLQPYVLS